MSYNISITRNDIPKDDRLAWNTVKELYDNDNGEASEDFTNLINQLTQKFPCITTLPDDQIDDGVWSDGPLINNAGNNITTLGVVFSQIENVIPFVIETANRNGFVVFDYQSHQIFRPQNSDSDKPSFWSKLFGKK
jgi:hypothetical protein